MMLRSKGSRSSLQCLISNFPRRDLATQQEGPRETKSPEYVQLATSIAYRHPLVSVRPCAFQPLNKKRETERERGRKSGSANSSEPSLSSLYRVVEFSTILSPSSQPPPKPSPRCTPASLSSHHVRVNNTPILCAPRRARFLSKWIHDEFLFRGLNARGSHFSSIFPFARALSPLTTANPVHHWPPFLIFSSAGGTRSHVECHGASEYERGLNFFNAEERDGETIYKFLLYTILNIFALQ